MVGRQYAVRRQGIDPALHWPSSASADNWCKAKDEYEYYLAKIVIVMRTIYKGNTNTHMPLQQTEHGSIAVAVSSLHAKSSHAGYYAYHAVGRARVST